jgi:hypothetical protein
MRRGHQHLSTPPRVVNINYHDTKAISTNSIQLRESIAAAQNPPTARWLRYRELPRKPKDFSLIFQPCALPRAYTVTDCLTACRDNGTMDHSHIDLNAFA